MIVVKSSATFAGAISLLLFVALDPGFARQPSAADVIGAAQKYRVNKNESLLEIARKFDLGMNEIADANPGVDRILPDTGLEVEIPTARILPDMSVRAGVVINVPEFRLYFFPPTPGEVLTFPIGVGDQGKDTPEGVYRVTEKIVHPAWHVPESIRKERPSLPVVVPPGPDNPMGSHALRLSRPALLIHGTDRPWGIGTRSSHGCIRLYPEDIVRLFELVPLGTKVTIVNQPLKAALQGDKVLAEAHRYNGGINVYAAIRVLAEKDLLERVDLDKLRKVLEEMNGMPVDVTRQISP